MKRLTEKKVPRRLGPSTSPHQRLPKKPHPPKQEQNKRGGRGEDRKKKGGRWRLLYRLRF